MKWKLFLIGLLTFILSACKSAGNFESSKLPIIDTGVNPAAWVTVPTGVYPSGQHDHWVELSYDFEIMVTDVTNHQFAEYLTSALADGSVHLGDVAIQQGEEIHLVKGIHGYYPGDPFDGYEHEFRIPPGEKLFFPTEESTLRIQNQGEIFASIPEYKMHPVTMVTWFGAQSYCQYYGWRLPFEQEWEKAARGTTREGDYARPFPWGNQIGEEYANYYSSSNLVEKLFGVMANTTPVGFYNGQRYGTFSTQDQASPYGLYDMAGNVWQWTGDDYPKQHYRYLRGGSYQSYAADLRVWKRNSASPSYFAPDIGFRCARESK